MAIINTRTVQRIEVFAADSVNQHPRMTVVYTHVFDDTEDADLPVETQKVKHLHKYIMERGSETEVLTDVSGEDPLVQTIAAAVWT
jgi:hypothetical protein